jgi:hypothetical protein
VTPRTVAHRFPYRFPLVGKSSVDILPISIFTEASLLDCRLVFLAVQFGNPRV